MSGLDQLPQLTLDKNKYISPTYCHAEMYAGRVACCPLVSHVEYAPRDLLTLEKMGQTDGRMDGQTDARPMHYAHR